ncbi:MAG: hypothetical protein NTU98_08510 [Bacteroidetes bacterium]|nr:hypothetical protein [Bacteroidota bacterium]
MKKDVIENRMNLSNQQGKVPHAKLQSGSVQNKYPVILDGGKTILFISDKSKEAEVIRRYEARKKTRP